MTEAEQKALEALVSAWNALVALPVEHPDDINEMRSMVHALQNMVLSRPTRREYNKRAPE